MSDKFDNLLEGLKNDPDAWRDFAQAAQDEVVCAEKVALRFFEMSSEEQRQDEEADVADRVEDAAAEGDFWGDGG